MHFIFCLAVVGCAIDLGIIKTGDGKMRVFLFGAIAACLLAIPVLQADEITTEAVPVMYFNMPFGGQGVANKDPVFGFKVVQTKFSQNGGFNLFSNKRPALMDLRMQGGEVDAFSFNGINALEKTQVVYADGTRVTSLGVNMQNVFVGLLLGGMVLCGMDVICDDKDSDPEPDIDEGTDVE